MIKILEKFNSKKSLIIAFLASLTWFIFIGNRRLIAKDEGFYLMAIQSVLSGKNVYYDFFYPQMPLLPYIYSIFFKFVDLTLVNARTVSALIPSLIGTLIFKYSYKNSNSIIFGYTFLILFLITNFVIAWFTVIQTYSISTLFLLISCLTLHKLNKKNLIIASISFSLAVACRLFFGGLFPLFILYILLNSKKEEKLKNCFIFTSFGLLAGISVIAYFLIDFDKFYLNNIGYHLSRTSKDFFQSLNNKYVVSKVILGLKPTVKFDAYHMQILFYVSLIGIISLSIFKQKVSISVYIIVGLIILNLIPSPTYVQYFSTLIPFLFLTCTDFLCFIKKQNSKVFYLITIIFVLSFIPYSKIDFERYTKSGKGVIGIGNQNNANHWNLENLEKIASIINNNCQKTNCSAISIWPGYLIGTNTEIISGYENHFANLLARNMNEEEKKLYKVRGNKDILKLTKLEQPDFVILNGKIGRKKKKNLENLGYKTLYKTRLIRIFKIE